MWVVFDGWGSEISVVVEVGFGPLAQEVKPVKMANAARGTRIILNIRAPVLMGH
jgi:hypothetical protein